MSIIAYLQKNKWVYNIKMVLLNKKEKVLLVTFFESDLIYVSIDKLKYTLLLPKGIERYYIALYTNHKKI